MSIQFNQVPNVALILMVTTHGPLIYFVFTTVAIMNAVFFQSMFLQI